MKQLLKEREILPLLNDRPWKERRKELFDILCEYAYGHTPKAPKEVRSKIIYEDKNAYAGKVLEQHVEISFDTPDGEYSFSIKMFIPFAVRKPPVLLHLAFRPEVPDKYVPAEEICDHGYALVVVCYQDITPDSYFGDFSAGLAAKYIKDNQRKPDEWGKIGMWAFGASRVIDYLVTRDDLDKNEISVCGHSRLGKTALWCAAQDERVYCVMANNAGYNGASLSKNSGKERIDMFVECGSYDWFCPNFTEFIHRDNEKPYDQHFLLALISPRYIYVSSAEDDFAADPTGELLSCIAANDAYKLYGKNGVCNADELPPVGTKLHDGEIGYHLRTGSHFLSRYDWLSFMEFLDKKRND